MGKTLIRSAFAIWSLFLGPLVLNAQVTVKSGISPESVVNDYLLGEGIKARNIKFTGDPRALGIFENPEGRPGFDKGILLSTGIAADAAGPNDNPKTSTALGQAGSKDLYAFAKTRTFDAAVLEFEFMAAKDSITLRFMYASEEYNDYVGSSFSDAFIIRISGPGFPNGRDLGLIPGTTTPINVNTVNYNTNGKYYQDNNPFTLAGRLNEKREAELDASVLKNFEYDGMTQVMAVGTQVKPRETYRIQIAIADAGDGNMDSGLFIEAGSMQSVEQYRWVLRREKIAEKRRLDSLARVAFVEDSLAREREIAERIAAREKARADSMAALEYEKSQFSEEEDGSEMMEEDSGWEEEGDDSEAEYVDETPAEEAEDAEYVEDKAEPYDYHTPPGPGDEDDYRAVIRFGREAYLVPEDSEELLGKITTFVLRNPELRVGIYVPGKSEKSTLRYDMVRAELLKGGLPPDRMFKNGFSFLSSEEAGSIHRVEIWVRGAE